MVYTCGSQLCLSGADSITSLLKGKRRIKICLHWHLVYYNTQFVNKMEQGLDNQLRWLLDDE